MVAIGHQAGLAVENTIFYNDKIQAERLAAVGQTIATLSHHIKNILQGIHGGSSLIDLGLKGKRRCHRSPGLDSRRGKPDQDLQHGHGYALILEGSRAGGSSRPTWMRRSATSSSAVPGLAGGELGV